jgi:hypothetical protein
LIGGIPSLPHCTTILGLLLVLPTFDLTFCKNRFVLVVLDIIKIFGPIFGIGDTNDLTNLIQKFILASSTSLDDCNDPSPNLFNDDNNGNSHSINRNDGVFGDLIAACIDTIA